MKNYIVIVSVLLGALMSCGEEEKKVNEENKFYTTEVPEANVLRVGIKQLEDSIMQISQTQGPQSKLTNLLKQAYLEKLKLLYQAYPKDKDAASSLAKIYKVYSDMGVSDLSVKYADTLIERYPKYEERWMALQYNAVYYDVEAVPRNKEKIRYYLEKLIKECPNIDPRTISDSKSRLETIDLTFEELIKEQN
jgi:tetratricopeptide (TPR) repeat protein